MNGRWNDEDVMRKTTLRPASNSSGHSPEGHGPDGGAWSAGEDLRGCRPCQGKKDLSQALSKKGEMKRTKGWTRRQADFFL